MTRTSNLDPAADERKSVAGADAWAAAEDERTPAERSTTAPPTERVPAADPDPAKEGDTPTSLPATTTRRTSSGTTAGELPEHLETYDTPGRAADDGKERIRISTQHPAADERRSAAGGDTRAAAVDTAAPVKRDTKVPTTKGSRRPADPAGARERDIHTSLARGIPTPPTTAPRTMTGKPPEHREMRDAPGWVEHEEGEIERDIPAPLPEKKPTTPARTTRRTSSRSTAGKMPERLKAYDTTG